MKEKEKVEESKHIDGKLKTFLQQAYNDETVKEYTLAGCNLSETRT